MTIARRSFILALVASAIGGGAVGGVIATATPSYADPAAVAAAVAHVQDQKAEHDLAVIATALSPQTPQSRGQNVYSILENICHGTAPADFTADCGQ